MTSGIRYRVTYVPGYSKYYWQPSTGQRYDYTHSPSVSISERRPARSDWRYFPQSPGGSIPTLYAWHWVISVGRVPAPHQAPWYPYPDLAGGAMGLKSFIDQLRRRPQLPIDTVTEPENYVYIQARNGHHVIATRRVKNLRRTAGRDWMASRLGNPADGNLAASFIALSSTNAAPSSGDTTLSGELTGALARQAAVYSHSAGSDTYTLSTSWTSGVTTTIYRGGVFNAASGGTLVFETSFAPISVVSGTTVAIYWTVRLS